MGRGRYRDTLFAKIIFESAPHFLPRGPPLPQGLDPPPMLSF